MKKTAPEAYARFVELAYASEKLSGTEKAELINRYKATYSEGTQTEFSEAKAINEITADYAGKLVHDVKMFQGLARADMNTAQRFIEAIRDFIAKVKTTFSKDKSKMDTAALEKYGATVSELEVAVKTYEEMIETTQAAVSSGQFNTENTAEAVKTEFSKKRIETLTENDVRKLLECSVYGEFDNRSYIPLRRNTLDILMKAVDVHTNGGFEIKDLPIAMKVEKVRQALEEEVFGDETRQYGISVDGMIEIIKGMDDPAYIILQENGRYVEVIRYYDGKNHAAWAVLDLGISKSASYMNGYSGGRYNILVTTFNPDDLGNYMETNVKEIIYDKKMKSSLQSGSGSLFPSHLNSSPFYTSVPELSEKSNSEFSIKGANLLYQATGGLYSSYFEELYEKGISEKGKGTIDKVAGAVPFASMIVEQALRLAELMSVLEKGDINDPDTVADALLAVAEVTTNFGESGTWGKVLNKISRIYLL